MRQVKSLVRLDGLLTKDQIYTVIHEMKGFVTIVDDRGVQCAYSAARFEAILAPQVAPDFRQMQQIADEVKVTLQPDESGIKCPVVEEFEKRKTIMQEYEDNPTLDVLTQKSPDVLMRDRIEELERENAVLKQALADSEKKHGGYQP